MLNTDLFSVKCSETGHFFILKAKLSMIMIMMMTMEAHRWYTIHP